MSNTANQFAAIWSKKLARVQRVMRGLPRDVGNFALAFFLAQFKKEESPAGQPWPKRKVDGSNLRSRRRALLVDSGALRKSIRITNSTSNSVSIGSNLSYAGYHNEGTGRLPQRQFIGKSDALTRKLQRHVKAKILVALRN